MRAYLAACVFAMYCSLARGDLSEAGGGTSSRVPCTCGVFLSGDFIWGSREGPRGNAALMHEHPDPLPCTPLGIKHCTNRCLDLGPGTFTSCLRDLGPLPPARGTWDLYLLPEGPGTFTSCPRDLGPLPPARGTWDLYLLPEGPGIFTSCPRDLGPLPPARGTWDLYLLPEGPGTCTSCPRDLGPVPPARGTWDLYLLPEGPGTFEIGDMGQRTTACGTALQITNPLVSYIDSGWSRDSTASRGHVRDRRQFRRPTFPILGTMLDIVKHLPSSPLIVCVGPSTETATRRGNPCPETYRYRGTSISNQLYHSSTSAEGKSNVSDVPVLVCDRPHSRDFVSPINMVEYTFAEYTDMILVYGAVEGDGRAVRRLYQERYPQRATPSRTLNAPVTQRLREQGTFTADRNDCGAPKRRRTPELEEAVLHHVEQSPSTSTRSVACAMGVAPSIVWEVLHEQQLDYILTTSKGNHRRPRGRPDIRRVAGVNWQRIAQDRVLVREELQRRVGEHILIRRKRVLLQGRRAIQVSCRVTSSSISPMITLRLQPANANVKTMTECYCQDNDRMLLSRQWQNANVKTMAECYCQDNDRMLIQYVRYVQGHRRFIIIEARPLSAGEVQTEALVFPSGSHLNGSGLGVANPPRPDPPYYRHFQLARAVFACQEWFCDPV
ncbi:hypothetical protein PR048_027072 [Dryococelus australis]|uniref:Uncharacterized protein n=1 Tax=Dryococelus australis TaxID=614101 RepID=A0ABQ9GEE6_9NEOP|nr:hypothetical protein PR048_027072 [Dryococelus australis]